MSRRKTAFYTPETVALRLATQLLLRRPAVVIDPACGDGQLLAAVSRQYGTAGLTLVGIDTSGRALVACKRRLRSLGVRSIRLYRGDFLTLASRIGLGTTGRRYVLMNPPFISYRHLSPRERRRLRTLTPGLSGRFNVADAFVLKALSTLGPKSLIAILPSSTGARLNANGHLNGHKVWRRLPDSTFAATISTGAMVWRRRQTRTSSLDRSTHTANEDRKATAAPVVVVRNGVATGADAVFMKMALGNVRSFGGRILRCARGRDVAREKFFAGLPKIWAPIGPSVGAREALARKDLQTLRARHCVQEGGKHLFDYHSAIPKWFLGTRKLVVPEICRRISVLDDRQGHVLPLHSTLAIRTTSDRAHRLAKALLLKPQTWDRLRRTSEMMVGGAIRLTSASLTAVLEKELSKKPRGR